MVSSATADNNAVTEEEDFEVIIDEPYLTVVRMNESYAASVHSPVDLVELSYQLAAAGFVTQEMIAFHDGVIEMQLRPIADIQDFPEDEHEIRAGVQQFINEREKIYA